MGGGTGIGSVEEPKRWGDGFPKPWNEVVEAAVGQYYLALETGGRRSVRIDDDRVQRADWVLIWEKRYDGCWCWRRVKVMERSL